MALQFSESRAKILKAFAECRRLVVEPGKSKQNTHLKNHYSTLGDVAKAIDPAMEATGLMLIQSPTHEEGQAPNVLLMAVELIHLPSGEFMRDVCQIPLPKADCQGFGSALTYARRYSKVAIFDLNMSDDDGNKGTRTAADSKKSMEAATSLDDLEAIYRVSIEYFNGDKASTRIVQDTYANCKVKLKQSTARPFNPSQPEGAKKGRSRVVVDSPAVDGQNAPAQQGGVEEEF